MDTSPTALFESYEQDFRQFIETIQEKLDDNGGDDKGCFKSLNITTHTHLSQLEKRKSNLRRVQMELEEADEMVCCPSSLAPSKAHSSRPCFS